MEDEVESATIDAPILEPASRVADAPQLSRSTWRQGKGRRMIKRVNNWGGVTVAPAAFLAMREKVCLKPGRPGRKICSAMKKDGSGKCGRLALKGMLVCESHGGQLALARQGRLQKSGRAAAAIAAKQDRAKMPEGRPSGVPPLELLKLRIYVEASERQRIRLAMAFQTDEWLGVVRSMQERSDPSPGAVRNEPPPGGVRKDFGDGGDW